MSNLIEDQQRIINTLEGFINYAKFSTTFEAPGKDRNYNIKVSLLWEGEYDDIIVQSGKVLDPLDNMSRAIWMKIETLVQQIDAIDDQVFKDDNNPTNHAFLKGVLRMILRKLDSTTITFIGEMIHLITQRRNSFVFDRSEEIKKKFAEKIMTLEPL